jgi:hypothetical protein
VVVAVSMVLVLVLILCHLFGFLTLLSLFLQRVGQLQWAGLFAVIRNIQLREEVVHEPFRFLSDLLKITLKSAVVLQYSTHILCEGRLHHVLKLLLLLKNDMGHLAGEVLKVLL